MKDKPEKLVLKPLNFADDIVRGSNGRKCAVFQYCSDTLFVNLNECGGAWSPLFVG